MYLALIGFSLYISYIDLKSHRIPNKSLFCALLLFLSITVAQGAPVYLKSAVISILISLPLVKFRVGAGDIKLLILTAFFYLPPNLAILIRFLSAFSAILSSIIVTGTLKVPFVLAGILKVLDHVKSEFTIALL